MINNNFYFKKGMSQAQLKVQAEKIATLAERDFEFLQTRGISAEMITNLRAKAQVLNGNFSHAYEMAQLKELTLIRNEKMTLVKDSIKLFRTRMEYMKSDSSSKYYAILNKALGSLSAEDLADLSLETLVVLNETLSQTAIYGITATMVAEFESLVEELIQANNNQILVAETIENKTFERSQIKKELHTLLVLISKTGQIYWKRINPTYSNNYKIIRSKKASTSSQADADDAF